MRRRRMGCFLRKKKRWNGWDSTFLLCVGRVTDLPRFLFLAGQDLPHGRVRLRGASLVGGARGGRRRIGFLLRRVGRSRLFRLRLVCLMRSILASGKLAEIACILKCRSRDRTGYSLP